MANTSWVKTDRVSGSGNATVNVSSTTEHTGRKARTAILTWRAANVTDVVRTVSQNGKREYVEIDERASSTKEGKLVTISGQSNSSKLTFSLSTTGSLNIELPDTYIANSMETKNGEAISGDPGVSAEYGFEITIEVPANDGTTEQSRQIIVTDNVGNQDICTLTLAAGEPYITIADAVIELDYKGTAVAVAVESNTTWSIV